jgi:hypothetical protein
MWEEEIIRDHWLTPWWIGLMVIGGLFMMWKMVEVTVINKERKKLDNDKSIKP